MPCPLGTCSGCSMAEVPSPCLGVWFDSNWQGWEIDFGHLVTVLRPLHVSLPLQFIMVFPHCLQSCFSLKQFLEYFPEWLLYVKLLNVAKRLSDIFAVFSCVMRIPATHHYWRARASSERNSNFMLSTSSSRMANHGAATIH